MRKKVTTDLIEKYLDKYGWEKHHSIDEPGEREGVVVTGWVSTRAPDGFMLFIDPIVEKDYIYFKVNDIARAPTDATPSDRLRDLLVAISAINYKLILGCFAYDPSDGELVFKFAIPVASDDLRYEDFERCLRALTISVEGHTDDFRAIIDGTKTAQDVMS